MNSNNRTDITVDHQHLTKALLESSSMLVAFLNPEFDFIQVNSAYAEADEKEPSFFPGKNHFDLYPNEENRQIFQQVVETGQPYQIQAKPFEYENNKERGVSWWDWSLAPVKDDSGRVTALILSLSDVTERKRAEQSHQEAEAELKHNIDLVPGIIAKANAQTGYFTHCNPALTSILGFSSEEFLARPFMEFVHPDDRQSTIDEVEKQLKGSPVARFENRYICKDGSYKWLEWRAKAADEKGIVYAAATDITERKRAEEALSLSEQRLELAHEAAGMGMFDWNIESDQAVCNDRYFGIFGLKPQAGMLSESDWLDMVHPDDRVRAQTEVRDTFTNRAPYNTEYRIIWPDGSARWVSSVAKVFFDNNGKPLRMIGTMTDITERKQAEESLRESEEKYRKLVETSQDLIWKCDAEGKFTYLNQAWEQILGYTTDEMLGRPFSDFQRPEVFERDIKEFAGHLAGGFVKGYETSHISKSGDDVHLVFNAIPLFDSDKNIIGTQGTAYDITERKLAEEALRASEERFRSIIENTDVGYFFIDQEGIFRDVNAAWVRMYKYASADDIIGEHFTVIQKADDVEKSKEFVAGIMAGDTRFLDGEFSRKCKDGSIGYHTFSARSVSRLGKVVGLEGFIIDTTERKRAEDALRVSEKKFRTYISSAPDAIFIADALGRYVEVNEAACRLTGYSKEELVQMSVSQLLDPALLEGAKERFEEFMKAGRASRETRIKVKDGSIISISLDAVVLSENRVMSFCSDITKTKRAEEALQESEERFRTQMVQSPMVMEIYDIDGLQIEVNRAYEELWGFPASTTVNKFNVLKSKEVEETGLMQHVKRAYAGEAVTLPEYEFDPTGATESGGPGRVRWLSTKIYPLKNSSGNVTNIVITHEDITERKQAREALRASEEKFRTYISHAPDAIFIADPQGRYVDVNEAACRLTGYSKIELTSMSITDLTDPEHSSEAQARFEDFTETGSLSTESRFRRKDGSIVCVSLDAVVLSEGLFMAFCSDITETKRLRELESRAQRLETAGQIAGQVAHDFNNLLAPLMAYPEFIRDELGPDHSALQYLDDIENAAQQIADINQQLLTLGRRGHYNQEAMNLNDVVTQAVRQLESLPSTLVVETDLDKELMNIKGGKSQVFRAISNLLVNAREAMQDIGQITVRTENFYVDEMWINYARVPQGEYVKLTISDTGCGIPDEIKQKIFEPFFTTKTTDKKRGSGLGISVVDAVIKDHDGHIDVASVMGEGTSFFLYFPVTRDSINTPLQKEIVGGNETVLIVDDDKVQRDVCTKLLSSLGYRTTAIASGEEALQLLTQQSFDLLILDMIMPLGIDGAETYRQTLLNNPDQRAIIVSGFAESDRVAAALKMGAGDFVKKPLTRGRLATAVRNELDRVAHPA